MPSLIKGAAQVYASEKMLGDRRLGSLMDLGAKQFKGLVFNSVEFRNGNSFRFQTSELGRAIIGNGNLRVDKEMAREIRLADIAAASSCFPQALNHFASLMIFSGQLAGLSPASVRRSALHLLNRCH